MALLCSKIGSPHRYIGGQQATRWNTLSEPRSFASTPVQIPQY
jgi:hypothetical protein